MSACSCFTRIRFLTDECLILGGYVHDYLNTSEYFSSGGFEPGPLLPEATEMASGVMFNATHLFLASGTSQNNYFLNVNTNEWTKLAKRFYSVMGHSTGAFFNATSQEREIVVTNMGGNQVQVYSVSANEWRNGPALPHLLSDSVAVQLENDFLLVGGVENAKSSYDEIFKFEANGTWTLLNRTLALGRYRHVALLIY